MQSMLDMDVRVLSRALDWARGGHTLWLCTVISTYGSSPAFRRDGLAQERR